MERFYHGVDDGLWDGATSPIGFDVGVLGVEERDAKTGLEDGGEGAGGWRGEIRDGEADAVAGRVREGPTFREKESFGSRYQAKVMDRKRIKLERGTNLPISTIP